MKIINDYPPNIEAIRRKFPLHKGVVFTYGENLYNPDGATIPEHLMVHEELHSERQAMLPGGPAAWWVLYLTDETFRLDEEARAYGEQYKFVASRSGREVRRQFLETLARQLSAPLYGNLTSFNKAKELIKFYAES